MTTTGQSVLHFRPVCVLQCLRDLRHRYISSQDSGDQNGIQFVHGSGNFHTFFSKFRKFLENFPTWIQFR